jgi:translation initiation factor eIF-2B subunit delta
VSRGPGAETQHGLIGRREAAALEAGVTGAGRFPDGAHIVTISRSATVLYALHEGAEKVSLLTVAESRPACEGRSTARTAAEFGVEVELVTDAVAAGAAGAADVVLFGADSVTEDGSVVNKAGTGALCCAAVRGGAETLCVTTDDKVLPAGLAPEMEQMDPAELGEPIPGVRRRNIYFERVPADLVGTLLLGGRVAGSEELARIARRRRDVQRELS